MTYVGAEAASDAVLKSMQKGTRVEHTFEVARRCRENGIIPEFSFVLGGPEDPEGEIETTFEFIRRLKTLSPESEIILYFYSPTPQRQRGAEHRQAGMARLPVLGNYGPSGPALPTTPEEWTQPRWISWVCHEERALADPAHPTTREGLRPRAGLSVPHRPGSPALPRGPGGPARPRQLALRHADLRLSVGAAAGPPPRPSARAAAGEHLISAGIRI